MRYLQNPIRRATEAVGWSLCLYALFRVLLFAIPARANGVWNGGLADITAVAVGAAGLCLLNRGALLRPVHTVPRQMSGGRCFFLLCVMLSAQLVYSLWGTAWEVVLQLFGKTNIFTADQDAVTTTNTIWMFLYSAIAAPIGEEIIYRGVVLRSFLPFGKVFAIISSAALFGVMHGDLYQFCFAFLTGLVLGYVACEYSIFWSTLFHVFNNLAYGEGLTALTQNWPWQAQNYFFRLVNIFFFAIGAFWLIFRRRNLLRYLEKNASPGRTYAVLGTSAGILLFAAWGIYQAVANIGDLANWS